MIPSQVIGIDFGGTSVKLAVVEGSELLTDVQRIQTQNFVGAEQLIDEIVKVISTLRSRSRFF